MRSGPPGPVQPKSLHLFHPLLLLLFAIFSSSAPYFFSRPSADQLLLALHQAALPAIYSCYPSPSWPVDRHFVPRFPSLLPLWVAFARTFSTYCYKYFLPLHSLNPFTSGALLAPPLPTKPQPLHRGRLLRSAAAAEARRIRSLDTSLTMALPDDKELESILGDGVDLNTFKQILEMDEPGDNEFSTSIVFGFFEQAEETFESMNTALNEKDLDKLSELGHFLKGSSATLGLIKVRDGCEKIQRYGKQENLDGSPEPDTDVCLERVKEALTAVKSDYEEVELGLKKFYDKDDEEEEGA
ncbi:signal transduction histidine kinase [Trichoderma gracile]